MWVLDAHSETPLGSGTQQGGFTDPAALTLPDLSILDKPEEKYPSHSRVVVAFGDFRG